MLSQAALFSFLRAPFAPTTPQRISPRPVQSLLSPAMQFALVSLAKAVHITNLALRHAFAEAAAAAYAAGRQPTTSEVIPSLIAEHPVSGLQLDSMSQPMQPVAIPSTATLSLTPMIGISPRVGTSGPMVAAAGLSPLVMMPTAPSATPPAPHERPSGRALPQLSINVNAGPAVVQIPMVFRLTPSSRVPGSSPLNPFAATAPAPSSPAGGHLFNKDVLDAAKEILSECHSMQCNSVVNTLMTCDCVLPCVFVNSVLPRRQDSVGGSGSIC